MKVTNSFKGKVKTYLVKRLGAFNYRHGWMRVPVCPYCHAEKKMGVNLSMWRTNCFKCGEHPSPTQLVMDVENLDNYGELIKLLNNGDYTELEFKDEKVELAEKKPVYLPDGFINISLGHSQIGRSMRGYVKKRGFDINYLSRLGVGYCTTGPLFGYLVIPFFYNGELRYYNARQVLGSGPRYNNPSKDITGLGKEFLIFNYDALNMYRTVFICEGALNALTMGERGIALMGKAFSRYQVNQILKSTCEHVIILLDPDAKEYAYKLGLELAHFKSVKVVILPDGKDVNDLGKSQTLKLIYQTRYMQYSELLKKKQLL